MSTDMKIKGNLVVEGSSLTVNGVQASTASSTETLINKTIDAASNTISNIADSNVSATAAIAYSKLNLTSSIVNADISAGAAIVYSKLSLASSITNSDIAALAAIAYSKLSLSNSIVNADINTAAAIAFSKMAALTANKALASDASGVVVASAVTDTELGYVSGVTSAIQTQLGSKLPLAGGTMSGAIAMGSNKITGLANGTAAGDAVNFSQLSGVTGGLVYVNPVSVQNMIDDSVTTPPGTPANKDIYLAAAGASGGFTAGHVYEYNSALASWVDVLGRAIVIGDRFGIVFESGTAAGGFSTKDGNIAEVTNATPGSYAYTFTAPSTSLAAYVNGANAQDLGHLYYYNGSVWIDLLGSAVLRPEAGAALSYNGNILNVGYDNVTLDLVTNQLEVKAGGISNTQVNASAAIAMSKLAALTAGKVLQSNSGTGFIEPSTVTNTELGYVSGVTSAIQTQINGKVDKSTLTTKGDVFVFDGTNVTRLPAGTNDYALVADSTQTLGLKYVPHVAPSAGDITETLFNLANNQVVAADVTGLVFANAVVRSFKALVSVEINATANLYEVFELNAIQKGASWDMSQFSTGDTSQVVFTITSAGQVQYTSGNATGFTSGKIKFRAITTSI